MSEQIHKIIIIGGGPAGLTAALYAARAGLTPLVFTGPMPGGLLTLTGTVENYPGFPEGIDGFTLTYQMEQQAKHYGAAVQSGTVKTIEKQADGTFKLTLQDNTEYHAQTVIVAAGASPRWLGLDSEQRLRAKGVSVCAHCDGPLYKNKVVSVIGGGDSAMEEATALSNYASEVHLIHRRDEFRASTIMLERAKNNPKIKFHTSCITEEIVGTDRVEGVKVKNQKTDQTELIPCSGVFIALGYAPNTDVLKGIVTLDEKGYPLPETAPAGLFLAGDCADYMYRQAITAASSGCQAAINAEKYLAASHQ